MRGTWIGNGAWHLGIDLGRRPGGMRKRPERHPGTHRATLWCHCVLVSLGRRRREETPLEAELVRNHQPTETVVTYFTSEDRGRKRRPSDVDDIVSDWPSIQGGDYVLPAGDGWRGHKGGTWLHSESDGVYFHIPTGTLFMEDATGKLAQLQTPSAPRTRGSIRWYSRAKGFGFVSVGTQDVFVHQKELPDEMQDHTSPVPVLPGMPVNFVLGEEENRVCATSMTVDTDLASMCGVGTSVGSRSRAVEKCSLDLESDSGVLLKGLFAGHVSGHQSMDGAEFIALRLARDLAGCLKGRKCCERGARIALQAAFRQTQQAFVEYARRLSPNSASVWLAAEADACTVLVFGPDSDGQARAICTTVGGGHVVVGRRDGTVAPTCRQTDESKRLKCSKDLLKEVERGLKGPQITFPSGLYGSVTPEPKGFGCHAWREHNGSGLMVDLTSYTLNWEEDAFLVLASDTTWQALPSDAEVAHLVWESLSAPGGNAAGRAAERLQKLACRRTDRDVVTVVRFGWCDMAVTRSTSGSVVPALGNSAETGSVSDTRGSTECRPSNKPVDGAAVLTDLLRRTQPVQRGCSESDMFLPCQVGGPQNIPSALLGSSTAAPSTGTDKEDEMDAMFAQLCQAIDEGM